MRYKVLSQNIKKFRKKSNLTQKELGEKIYKSEISIRKYESGKVNIPVSTLFDICMALGVTLEEILGSDIDIYYTDNNLSDDVFTNMLMDVSQKALEKANKVISETDRIVSEAGVSDIDYSFLLEAEIAFLSNTNVEKSFNYSFDDLAKKGGYHNLLIIAIEKAIKQTLIDIEEHTKKGDIFDDWGSWISKESPAYEAIKKVKEKNKNDNKPSK